jgi:hypothetical protein
MKVYIVHNEAGEISSVVRVDDGPADAPPPPVPVEQEGFTVAEVPAEGPAAKQSPLELHENYRFDVKRGKLVRKSQAAKKAKPDGQDE